MKTINQLFYQISILIISIFIIEVVLRTINSDMTNYNIEMWRYANELKSKDSLIGHRHLTNKKSTLQGVEIKLNSLGMRSEEFDKEDNLILFLGSSISLGWGVENIDSYPEIIQLKLNKDSLNYKVLNGSIGNYNTYRYINNFLTNYQNLSPNIIILNYFINDAETLKVGNSNWFVKNSQLIATLTIAYKKMTSESGNDLKSYYNELYRDDNPSYIEMKNSLKKLCKYSREKNIPVLLTVIPDIHFLENYPFKEIHEKLKKISLELGFEFQDLLPSLEGLPFKDLQIIQGDSHPNEYGHKKIADSLYPSINKIIKDIYY